MADTKTRAEVISSVAKDAAAAFKEIAIALPVVAVLVALLWFDRDLNDFLDRYGITDVGPIKRQIKANDETIIKLNGRLNDAYARLEESNRLLRDVGAESSLKANAEKQIKRNSEQLELKPETQSAAQRQFQQNTKTIQSLERKQTTAEPSWAIVFGGDRTVGEAEHEIATARKLNDGLLLATYLRQGSYRSVAHFNARDDAARALSLLQQVNRGAYVVKLDTWCPNRKEMPAEAGRKFPLYRC